MQLSRNEIMTLQEAARMYNLSERQVAKIAAQLEPRALRHLGYQEGRGFFYRIADIEDIVFDLRIEVTPPRRLRNKR